MEYIIYFLIACIFIRIAYVDYREHAIYDRDTLLAFVLIFISKYFTGHLLNSFIYCGFGLAIGFVIFFIAYKYYGFEAFGLGDVFLLGVLGFFFSQDFLNYLSLSLMVSGYLVILLIPFMGYKRVCQIEMPMAPLLLAWVPIFVLLGKPSIIHLLQRFI